MNIPRNIFFFSVAVLAHISSSSCQDKLKEDLENAVAPYMNAALSTKPLLDLLVKDFYWMKNNYLGSDPKILRSAYREFSQKLAGLESVARTQGSKQCLSNAKNLLDSTTDMFRSDGSCIKQREEELYEIGFALYKAIFPEPPTAACPIPILCKLNILNLGVMEIKGALDTFKSALGNGRKLLEFGLYYARDLRKCRRDIEKYKRIASSIINLGTLCRNL